MKNIIELSKSLLTGATVGALFALLRLPVPAPQVLGGVLGIIGLWLGYFAVSYLVKK